MTTSFYFLSPEARIILLTIKLGETKEVVTWTGMDHGSARPIKTNACGQILNTALIQAIQVGFDH